MYVMSAEAHGIRTRFLDDSGGDVAQRSDGQAGAKYAF
jgi:hypothetical protein